MNKYENILLHMMSKWQPQITDFCDLETVDGIPADHQKKIKDRQILVYQDGSCASVLKFNGIKSLMTRNDFEDLLDRMYLTLEPFLRRKGHQVQVLFRRDLDASERLNRMAASQKATLDRLNLDLHDLLDEEVEKYAQYVYEEDTYFVLYSRPALLDRVEIQMDSENKGKLRKTYHLPDFSDGQNLLRPISYLYERHEAFVAKFCDDLNSHQLGIDVERMDINSALREIKRTANRNGTHPTWKPIIPGNGVSPLWNESEDLDSAGKILYPKLPDQILNEPATLGRKKDLNIPDDEFIRIGDRVYAPLVLTTPPTSNRETFNSLFNALNRAETVQNGQRRAIPFSVSFLLEGDGMNIGTFKTIFSNIFAFTSEQNRNINLATKELREYVRDGGCVVKLRIGLMTWSDSDPVSVQELKLRKNKLKNAIEGWSSARYKVISGDAAYSWQSNCLALSYRHSGKPCSGPLNRVLQLLPLTRPASSFPHGTILSRSLDGAILPLEPFSPEQTTWIDLFAGKPGMGKSVLMNYLNLKSCQASGLKRLPYIFVADIGVSSGGCIDLIRQALPPEKRHLVVYKRIQNTEEYGINVMDVPLLQDFPLQREMQFKAGFITALVTPPELDRPEAGMTGFVTRVLREAYLLARDDTEKGHPKQYTRFQDKEVDEAVSKLGYDLNGSINISYKELARRFFAKGMYHECELVQRYAVPTLQDLGHAANSDAVNEEFKHELGQKLKASFMMGLRDAIEQYPIFRGITRFDIGSARVMSIDLQDVAGKDKSVAGVKQTNLMYLIARQSFMQKIAYSKEDLPSFSSEVRPYYERLISELVEEEKIVMFDEYHKTRVEGTDPNKSSPLQEQILVDGREGRKWKMRLVLGSQLLPDFGTLVDIATNIYLLDAGTPKEREFYVNRLGITEAAVSALQEHVHGPTRHGTTFLLVSDTKSGRFCQLHTVTVGPMCLWALSTTAEDRKMREIFYQHFDSPQEARAALAYFFPGGGCAQDVANEKRLLELESKNSFISDDDVTGIVEAMAKRCIDEYYRSSSHTAA